MSEVIRVDHLKKSYQKGFLLRSVPALNGASFYVRSGRITGFIGANGAGKTTTLRCLLNFTRPDSGRFYFFGKEGLSAEARRSIGYLPEHPHFYGFLTGLEFLKFYADLSGTSRSKKQLLQALERVKLEHAAMRPLKGYSKGMLQRVGLAQALIHEPQLLILDEPMSGLDPDGRRLVREILKEVAGRGVTLFFSTHLLDDAENLCQDIVLMSEGLVPYAGDLQSLFDRFDQKTLITYQTAAANSLQEHFSSHEEANRRIAEILNQGGRILEVKNQRQNLEQVFTRLTQSQSLKEGS